MPWKMKPPMLLIAEHASSRNGPCSHLLAGDSQPAWKVLCWLLVPFLIAVSLLHVIALFTQAFTLIPNWVKSL